MTREEKKNLNMYYNQMFSKNSVAAILFIIALKLPVLKQTKTNILYYIKQIQPKFC